MKTLDFLCSHALELLLPHQCPLCLEQCSSYICRACNASTPRIEHACSVCALPLTAATSPAICGECLTKTPYFDRAFCAVEYSPSCAALINSFKRKKTLAAGKYLSRLLAEKITRETNNDALPELLVPVPIHRLTYLDRGFNQAQFIARELSRKLKVPNAKLVEKIRSTKKQKTLSRRERENNLKGSFRIKKSADIPKHIALIDDVITTGATSNYLSKLLKKSGAKKIEIWALARTPK